jgi:competence protein ComEC
MREVRFAPVFALAIGAGCGDDEGNPFDPSYDTTPPNLLAVSVVTSDDGTRAWVEWQADEPVRAVVEYGVDRSELRGHAYSRTSEYGTSGRTRLLVGTPGLSYEYQIRMWDRAMNESAQLLAANPLLQVPPGLATEALMVVAMIDVGWGDAIYLDVPDSPTQGRRNVLIDAGHPGDGARVAAWLRSHGITGLDYASLSHIHEDHVGGFYGDTFTGSPGVFDDFAPTTFLDFDDKTGINGPYSDLVAAIPAATEHVFLRWGASSLDPGSELAWGDARVDLLAAGRKPYVRPDHALATNANSVENNDSMVWRVQYGEFVAMLTGDGEFASEQFLQDHWPVDFLRADLLKLGHHGSNDASSERWIDVVQPTVGWVPNAVSENAGVEHPFVLNRLRNRGIDYYASDRVIPNRPRDLPGVRGDVLVYTDGNDYTVVVENVSYE